MWIKSVNSTIFFWHAQKLRQGVYLRDFSFVIYGKFNSNFPALFFSFLSFGLYIAQVTFLVPFCWSVNCMSWTLDFKEMSRSLNMNLYLRAFSTDIYLKLDFYYLCLFRLFSSLQIVQFWSVNYASYFRS